MKNLNTIKKSRYSFLAMLLFSIAFSYAQVVSVPANCTVLATNTSLGGVLGAGGKVTDGGVVSMPDPSGGGSFTFGAFGTNIIGPGISWSLRGDLSTTNTLSIPLDPLSYYNAATQSASGATTNIITYNKTLRPSENVSVQSPNNVAAWARSKGRVTIGYTITNGTNTCGNSMTFDIFKTFAPVLSTTAPFPPINIPKIVGPDCIQAGVSCTFSVDQVASDNANDAIGFDQYYWTGIPSVAPNSLYYSADNSSVTFIPTSSAAVTLRCCIGRSNPWDGGFLPFQGPVQAVTGTTCISKSVGALPGTPTLSVPVPACIATGTTTFTTTITPIAGYTYVWTTTNAAWGLAQSGTQNSVLNVTIGDNNPTKLTLTITNGTCTPTVIDYNINRTLAPGLGITGLSGTAAATCISTASSYSLPTNALGNLTTWTISPVVAGGPTVVGIGTGSTSTCTVTPGTAAGQFSLIATSRAITTCTSTATSIIINIRPATPTINASSPTCVTRGTTATAAFTCTAISGASGYTWNLGSAPGWSCSTGCTTSSATFIPNATLGGPATITVTALGTNGCNSSVSANFLVNYLAVAPSGITASCTTAGSSSAVATVANPQNYGYYTVTSVPAGITGGNTSGINMPLTIPVGLAAGSYSLFVTHNNTNSCGTATNTIGFPISVTANSASVMLSPGPGAGNSDIYIASGGSSYNWFINGVAAVASANVIISSNLLQIKGNGSTIPTSVCVDVISGSCTTRVCANLTGATHTTRLAEPSGIKGITISPNPNSGIFFINVDSFKTSANATLYDITGKQLSTYSLKKGENKIENEGLAKGTYIVSLSIDGRTEAQQIIIK